MRDDEELRNEFIRLQNISSLSQLLQQPSTDSESRESLRQFYQRLQSVKRKKAIFNLLQYAAIILLLIGSTFFITHLLSKPKELIELNKLYVPAGQRAQLTLSDGTEVWINSGSTLIYPAQFSEKQRDVTLQGEAYFSVTENHKRPFTVNTERLKMEVLGTEFNVFSYPESGYTQTVLVEGSLRVSIRGANAKQTLLSPNQQATLYNNNLIIEKTTHPDHLLWRNGIYAFNNECLIDIIKKLELYYDITIQVEDPEKFNVRYTGKFRQRDGIDEILRILQKIKPFKILKDKEKNIITLSK